MNEFIDVSSRIFQKFTSEKLNARLSNRVRGLTNTRNRPFERIAYSLYTKILFKWGGDCRFFFEYNLKVALELPKLSAIFEPCSKKI